MTVYHLWQVKHRACSQCRSACIGSCSACDIYNKPSSRLPLLLIMPMVTFPAGILTITVKTIANTNNNTLAKSTANTNTNTAVKNYCQYQHQCFRDDTFHSLLHSATFIFFHSHLLLKFTKCLLLRE